MNGFLETIIFFYVLKHPELAAKFKGKFFNSQPIQELFEILKGHVLEYRSMPTETQAIDLVKIAGKDEVLTDDIIHTIWQSESKVNEYTDEWLKENTSAYAEWQNLMCSLKRVLAYIKTSQGDITFENCKEVIEKVKAMFNADASFAFDSTEGHDFFDINSHVMQTFDTKPTGYKFMDIALNGGWAKKTLNVLMGSPKVGKSMWLCNLAANSVDSGLNTVYITLELSYHLVNQRIGANLFDIPIKEYRDYVQDIEKFKEKVSTYQAKKAGAFQKPGKFFIEEFPTSSATVYDIEAFILKKEAELSTEDRPFKFDNVFIDYINIMKDYKNPNSENTYQKIKSICEDVRAMSQRNNWCVVSVTQTNRSAFDATDINMSNVSESAGLIATVDSLFGIIQTAVMNAEGVYYLKAVALRNSDAMGNKKKYVVDKRFLRIAEDTTEDIVVEGMDIPKKWTALANPQYNNVGQPKEKQQELPNLGLSELRISGRDLFEAS